MRRDGLCFACSLKHKELWKDGYGLEVERECPEDLREIESIVEKEGENEGWAE